MINTNGAFSGFSSNQVLPIQGCSSYSRPNSDFSIKTTYCYSDYVSFELHTYSSSNLCYGETISSSVTGVNVSYSDLMNSVECVIKMEDKEKFQTFSGSIAGSGYSAMSYISTSWLGYTASNIKAGQWYKIHLKPCMKIVSGTGDIATPFIIKSSC